MGIRHQFRPDFLPLEPRDQMDVAGIATAVGGLYSSPVVVAARAAVLGYQVGQLAWTGHTGFLLGSVNVTQPYPLKAVLSHGPHRHPPNAPQGPALLQVRLGPPHLPFRIPLGSSAHH
jgi:hypothetical protein